MIEQTKGLTWLCPRCANELGELNGHCLYCEIESNEKIYNPDKYYIRDIRILHITKGDKTMTPQEELFSELFNHETILVKDMDTLTRRAHREQLAKIAFEARARLSAVDKIEEDEKKANKKQNGPRGFERSVNTDDKTQESINIVKERQKRMSKQEKIQAQLEKLGINTADATKLMTAGVILGRITSAAKTTEEVKPEEPKKPLFNPFAKKEE